MSKNDRNNPNNNNYRIKNEKSIFFFFSVQLRRSTKYSLVRRVNKSETVADNSNRLEEQHKIVNYDVNELLGML